MRIRPASLLVLFFAAFYGGLSAKPQPTSDPGPEPYLVDYRAAVTAEDLRGWPLAIVHPSAGLDLRKAQEAGTEVLAYLSVIEVAADALYAEDLEERGLLPVGENENWRSGIMDIRDPEWAAFVVEELVPPLVHRGFDGLFLDTVDSYEFLIEKSPSDEAAIREAMAGLIREIREAFPDGKLVMNRGFALLEPLSGVVDGLLVESVFQTVDLSSEAYAPVASAESEALLRELRRAQHLGYEGFVLDYVSPAEDGLAWETARRIEAKGFRALVSTPDLMGRSLAPLRQVERNLLVLYGKYKDSAYLEYPMDTYTFRGWQTSLEWLGFELEYRSLLNEGLPAEPLSPELHGLIIDGGLVVPADRQLAFWDFVRRVVESGRKVFFCGALPPVPDAVRPWLEKELGLEGSFQHVELKESPQLDFDQVVGSGFEIDSGRGLKSLIDVRVTDEATRVWLGARGIDAGGRAVRMDAAFSADWGGAIFRPFDASIDPLGRLRLFLEPIRFGAMIFDKPAAPVPDTTTAQGTRVFYSHIDGDGFMNGSEVVPGQYSGEVIRDRILKAYPLPVTASFITGELMGQAFEPKFGSMERIVEAAREIVALPHIEPASHTKSHPYYWSLKDRQASKYEFQSLDLKGGGAYTFGGREFGAEIVGSVDYINQTLFGGEPACELLLWSGNCRPPPEALKVAGDAGILTMNGGDTLITSSAPFRSMIAPRSVAWRGQVQVFAANQNENVFNNAFNDGLFGGYANVIESFQMTERPVRFKPVNVYYHFYSGDRPASFRDLKRVLDWVMGQELFPLTGTAYVRSVLAARTARIFQQEDGFRLIAEPGLRTWRYPVALGYPDMERSRGVLGFNDVGDQRYLIREPGLPVDLVLRAEPPTVPYVRSATIPNRLERESDGWTFRAAGWRRGSIWIANAERLGAPKLPEGAQFSLRDDGIGQLEVEPGMVVRFSIAEKEVQP